MAQNPTSDAGTTAAPTNKGRGERRERRDDREKDKSPFMERVVFINRVSKVVKGGRRFSFTALFFTVPRVQGTIPHPVQGETAAGVILLRPASPGTGVIAGGPVRAVLECAGISDVLTKSLGSNNAINMVHATVAALKMLESPAAIAARRGLPLEDVAPAAIIRASQTVGA